MSFWRDRFRKKDDEDIWEERRIQKKSKNDNFSYFFKSDLRCVRVRLSVG